VASPDIESAARFVPQSNAPIRATRRAEIASPLRGPYQGRSICTCCCSIRPQAARDLATMQRLPVLSAGTRSAQSTPAGEPKSIIRDLLVAGEVGRPRVFSRSRAVLPRRARRMPPYRYRRTVR